MLRIQFSDYEALREHGKQTYPHECCGVLLGRSVDGVNEVEEIVEAGNTRTDSAHNRYQIAPVELIRIQRQARAKSLDIVGFYHSHPDHPAQWSATDIAEAHWLAVRVGKDILVSLTSIEIGMTSKGRKCASR